MSLAGRQGWIDGHHDNDDELMISRIEHDQHGHQEFGC